MILKRRTSYILFVLCLTILLFFAIISEYFATTKPLTALHAPKAKNDPQSNSSSNNQLKGNSNDILHSELISAQTELLNLKQKIAAREYSNKRLGIVTIHIPPWYESEGGWTNWTISNHKKYCKKHNYANYIENGKSDPRSGVWSKITALLRHMEDDKHDWFWALDVDTLVMNGHFLAEDVLDDNYELIFNRDWNWFNAGSFFIKNSEWSKQYLRKVLNIKKPDPEFFEEQGAMYNVLDQNEGYHSKVKWVPQRLINSYHISSCGNYEKDEEERKKCEYQAGDFVIHFASPYAKSILIPEKLIEYYHNATGLEGIAIP